MKYIKFKNDHPSGAFMKNDIVKIPKASLDVWIESGHIEESTEKDYQKNLDNKAKSIDKAKAKAAKEHFEKQNSNGTSAEVIEETIASGNKEKDKGLGKSKSTGNESKEDSTNGGDGLQQNEEDESPKYYTLTKNDIEQNGELVEGFKEGDEIEVNDQNIWLIDEDDKLIKKPVE